MQQRAVTRRGPLFWGGLYCAAIAAVAFGRITDAIGTTTGLLLTVASSAGLVPPMAMSGLRRSRDEGGTSEAILRYTRRFLLATFAYLAGLGLATWAYKHGITARGPAALLALLPAVPTLAMVWTMARYLVEEQDEYLRHRAVQAALAGLGCVLALGSFLGFLETFGVVPHVWSWWVVPVWAIGMGLWQVVAKVRDA